MQKKRRTALLMLAVPALVLIVWTTACRRPQQNEAATIVYPTDDPYRFLARFETMGTDAAIMVYAGDKDQARSFVGPAVEAVKKIDRLMNFYRPDSELSALNSAGPGDVIEVSGHTYAVMERAIHFSRITAGAFDPGFAPLKKLWREAQADNKLPSGEMVQNALERVGAGRVKLLEDDRIMLLTEGVLLDLGGIAKGYGVDVALEELKKAGCRSALVDIGGDMAVLGRKKDGQKWRVQVLDPRKGDYDPMVLEVENIALATSGDYARYFTVEGRRFSHIIDPRSGWPVANVPSVTVIAPDATTADALATALSVLGAEKGVELVNALQGVECMIMEREEDSEEGDIKIHYSDGFRRWMAP